MPVFDFITFTENYIKYNYFKKQYFPNIDFCENENLWVHYLLGRYKIGKSASFASIHPAVFKRKNELWDGVCIAGIYNKTAFLL